tara:strand:+ start:1205 stop:2848 length:1644 start_codon:yes stop_codon:yes gene_type:complete
MTFKLQKTDPSFTLPFKLNRLTAFTLLSLGLVACGGGGDSEEKTPPSAIVNVAPTANAGRNQSINENTTVNLSGTGTDSDGSISNYSWAQTGGDSVSLSGSDSAIASFTAPILTAETTLTFELTVTDNDGTAAKDSLTITVLPVNIAPIANAGVGSTVNPYTSVSLDASVSLDEDGEIVSYAWAQTSGTEMNITNADTVNASFGTTTAIEGETLGFSLTITDNEGATDTSDIDIYVNEHPIAFAKDYQIVETEHEISIDGIDSTDDAGIVNYSWLQTVGTSVTINNADTDNPTFSSDFSDDEKITFELTVTDEMGLTATDTVDIDVVKINRFINDTGVTLSGGVASGNDMACEVFEGIKQDCEVGRDALALASTLTKTGSGDAGFDYTKLDATGSDLSADALSWTCVLDNYTGLMWEVKTTDSSMHHYLDNYRWGGKGAIGNDSVDKQGTYHDEWDVLVEDANTNTFCGKNTWRLPTIEELASLAHKGKSAPSIDVDYFPNTVNQMYWTANPASDNDGQAWAIHFSAGYDSIQSRTGFNYVRLVADK